MAVRDYKLSNHDPNPVQILDTGVWGFCVSIPLGGNPERWEIGAGFRKRMGSPDANAGSGPA